MLSARQIYRLNNINPVIKYLTLSDLLLLAGFGLAAPFIPVFIVEELPGGTIATAGFATGIFFVTRSLLQIPIASILDGKKGEKDDFMLLVLGSLLTALSAFLYIISTEMWHVYAIQVVTGVSTALSYPAWYAMFSRHLDKDNEAFEWSFYDTVVSLGTAATASLGGIMIAKYGFDLLFALVGLVTFIGAVVLLRIKKNIIQR